MTKNRDIYIRMLMFVIDIVCLIISFVVASYTWIDLYLGRFILWGNNYAFLAAYLATSLALFTSRAFIDSFAIS